MKLATKYIHAGAHPDPSTGAIMTPIYQTSTYVQSAPGVHQGYEYARSQNPTRFALEEAFAVIENGKFGLAFASGVAATDAVMRLLVPGDEVVAAHDMYGGSFRLFSKVHEKDILSIEPDCLELMKKYRWPGNIRELENIIERAFIVESTIIMTVSSLPDQIKSEITTTESILDNTFAVSFSKCSKLG
jgi:cystathionine beta-lyase/cystathionine gamma-synthase